MRILLLMESLPESGVYTGVIQSGIIDTLLSAGHQVTIICNRVNISLSVLYEKIEWQQPVLPKIKIFRKHSLLSCLKNRIGAGKREIVAWKRVIESALSRQRYDLILSLPDSEHFHSCFAMTLIKTPTPWIVNFPQLLFNTFSHNNANLVNFGCEHKYRRQIEVVLHSATYVSFASSRIASYMKSHYSVLKKKSLYLPYPRINPDKFSYFPADVETVLESGMFNILLVDHLADSPGHRRFLNAYLRFLDYVDRSKVMLTVVGVVEKRLKPADLGRSLRVVENPVSYRRCQELIRESSVLLTIDSETDTSYRLFPELAGYIASGKPVLAVTPQGSETARLLGDYYPYRCNYNDTDEICMTLLLMWDEWQDKTTRKIILDDVLYLFSNQNYNSVVTMAVKQSAGKLVDSCRID